MRLKVKYFYFSKYIVAIFKCLRIQNCFHFFSGIAEHPADMVEDEEDSEVEFVKK